MKCYSLSGSVRNASSFSVGTKQLWIADLVKAAVGHLGREHLDAILMLSWDGGMGEIHCSVFSLFHYLFRGNTCYINLSFQTNSHETSLSL